MYGDGGSSDSIARDMNSLLYSSRFKHPSDVDFAKIKELISSNAYSNYNRHESNGNHLKDQNQNLNGGGQNESPLTRYRSAPSSIFANLLNDGECDDFLDPVDTSSNHEPEERFFSSNQHQFESDSHDYLQYASSPTSMKLETKDAAIDQNLGLPSSSRAMFVGSSQRVLNLPPIKSNNHINCKSLESSSTVTAMNSTNSNLIRQSSSPSGFLSSLNAENGFAGIRDVGKANSSSRLDNHISFSSGPSTSQMFFPQIPENTNEMNDSTFSSLKRTRNGDPKMFSSSIALDTQNGASGHCTPSLVHHVSLPKTSSEKADVEKFLRFEQDTTPCKIRAKRGHATHPRSIAERLRRTRISERMKKLQELFPTVDKHTSTADMLDLAVDYIKGIQKELQILKDARGRCTCSNKQLQSGSTK